MLTVLPIPLFVSKQPYTTTLEIHGLLYSACPVGNTPYNQALLVSCDAYIFQQALHAFHRLLSFRVTFIPINRFSAIRTEVKMTIFNERIFTSVTFVKRLYTLLLFFLWLPIAYPETAPLAPFLDYECPSAWIFCPGAPSFSIIQHNSICPEKTICPDFIIDRFHSLECHSIHSGSPSFDQSIDCPQRLQNA